MSIDQPDTDFVASVSEITPDGTVIPLSSDVMRARYRESPRIQKLVTSKAPLRYDFNRFTFASRMLQKGSRIRVSISAANSIFNEKNYNSGKVVADETLRDAHPVEVAILHDAKHPSALFVPYAAR
jgi:predicted acyl esterase